MGRRHIRSVYLRTPKTPRPIASREGQKDALALFSQPRSNDAVRRSLENTLSPESSREIRPQPQQAIDGSHLPSKLSAGGEGGASAPIKSEIAAEPQLSFDPSPRREAAEDAKSFDGADVEALARWMIGAESDAFLSHQAAREAWQPGTNNWFFESPEFRRWENGASNFMWISGNPGSGKTTLCSAVIDTLKARHGPQNPAALAYYYCRDDDQKTQEDDLILRIIIGQLSHQRQSPFACLQRLYKRSTKTQSHPSRTELVSVLQEILGSFATTYIIIDGLDQYPGRANFFDALREIWTGGVRLRVMILSRRDSATEDYLMSTPVEKEYFTIRKHHVNFVAETLVRRQIRESPLMRGFRDFEDKWTQTLVEKSHGMLSWISLQIRRLQACSTTESVREVLSTSPAQIDYFPTDLVQTLTNGIKPGDFISHMLEVLSISSQTLSIKELEELVTFHLRTSPQFRPDYVHRDLREAFDICSAFLAFSDHASDQKPTGMSKSSTEYVDLIHPSLKEFFFSAEIKNGPAEAFGISKVQAHSHMAALCLDYLLQFTETMIPSPEVFETYPFLQYSARFWFVHATQADSARLHDLMLKLFTSDVCFSNWLSVHDPEDSESTRLKRRYPSPVYYTALFGFYELAQALLARGARLDEAGGKLNYPLLAAVEAGHESVVRLFLEEIEKIQQSVSASLRKILHQDDVERRFKDGETALIRATSQGRLRIVKLLLEQGADTEATDARHLTALHRSAQQGHEEIAQLLIDFGADIGAMDADGRTALYYAIINRKASMSALLLNNNSSPQSPDRHGDTLLHHASRGSYLEGMRLLLQGGANPETHDRFGETALHISARLSNPAGVGLLLENRANPQARIRPSGRTAMHYAAIIGDFKDDDEETANKPAQLINDAAAEEIVHLLLRAGADVTIKDDGGMVPSDYARNRTRPRLSEILLREEQRRTTEKGHTPMELDDEQYSPSTTASSRTSSWSNTAKLSRLELDPMKRPQVAIPRAQALRDSPKHTRIAKRSSYPASPVARDPSKPAKIAKKEPKTPSTPSSRSTGLLPCPHCSMTFSSDSTLKKHVLASHTRPFICTLHAYGCESTVGSKNEWKRHINIQHMRFETWRCDVGACAPQTITPDGQLASSSHEPFYHDFDRKDLFTQHLKRMHAPAPSASNAEKTAFNDAIDNVQRRCYVRLRELPANTVCPFCAEHPTFRKWEDRIEHVGKHLEKGDVDLAAEVEDITLRDWMVSQGFLAREGGEWRLKDVAKKKKRLGKVGIDGGEDEEEEEEEIRNE